MYFLHLGVKGLSLSFCLSHGVRNPAARKLMMVRFSTHTWRTSTVVRLRECYYSVQRICTNMFSQSKAAAYNDIDYGTTMPSYSKFRRLKIADRNHALSKLKTEQTQLTWLYWTGIVISLPRAWSVGHATTTHKCKAFRLQLPWGQFRTRFRPWYTWKTFTYWTVWSLVVVMKINENP